MGTEKKCNKQVSKSESKIVFELMHATKVGNPNMLISRAENRCWSLNQHLLVVKWSKMLIFDIKNSKNVEIFCTYFCTIPNKIIDKK